MSDDRVVLSKEQAISMLSDDETIHTYRNAGFMLVGCDWDRAELLEAIEKNECELGGPMCQQMRHGLVIHIGDSPLFVECREGIDYEAFGYTNQES